MKATWHLSDGRVPPHFAEVTKGASGDLEVLIAAGHKLARRARLSLVGWRFEWKSW